MSNKEQKCECNSVGAHHSDCPMSMCFFKKCEHRIRTLPNGDLICNKCEEILYVTTNPHAVPSQDKPFQNIVGKRLEAMGIPKWKEVEDTKPEWEKDFLDKFLRYIVNDESLPSLGMLDHIRSTLLTQRNELEREIEGMMKPKSYWSYPWWRGDEIAYNQALSDVLEVLKGKQK